MKSTKKKVSGEDENSPENKVDSDSTSKEQLASSTDSADAAMNEDTLSALPQKDLEEAQQALDPIKRLDQAIAITEKEIAELRASLSSSNLEKRYASDDAKPSTTDKKFVSIQIKAKQSFLVLAKAERYSRKVNFDTLINSKKTELSEKITSDKARSQFFIGKNKGHIKNKLIAFIGDLKLDNARQFNALKKLSKKTGSKQKELFEVQFFELLRSYDSALYKKCTGTQSFRKEVLDFVREQFQLL